ncbi:FAD-linked oxidoreductase, partial [Aureobasidium melanogenum]
MSSLKLRSNMVRRLDGRVATPFLMSARHIHSTPAEQHAMTAPQVATLPKHVPGSKVTKTNKTPALAVLPFSTVLRTYMITSISCKPALLSVCFKALTAMIHAKNPIFNVERNPLLKLILRETFYKQFCGGETKAEVRATRAQLQSLGYSGVIFEYAREILSDVPSSDTAADVEMWRKGLMETVEAAQPGDIIGLKWSGMGGYAMQLLKQGKQPIDIMDKAMKEICDAASAKQIALVPSAEETTTNPMIDAWTLNLQKIYNKPDNIVLYNTYQCYLKGAPASLANHLHQAKTEGFTLGVKLVRGAYLHSEPREKIWDTIQDTHRAYDGMAEAVLTRTYNDVVKPISSDDGVFPRNVGLVLATHNADSVRKAQAIRTNQLRSGEERIPCAYAQLQGMADEVSCELISATQAKPEEMVDIPRAYKLTAWGSMTDCLNYLLRRAAENKDAASRTVESRDAMRGEIWRRMKATFNLA